MLKNQLNFSAHSRKYEFSDDKQTLIIPNFEAEKDDGIYNCNAAQYSSFETLSINVTGYCSYIDLLSF